MDLIPEFVQSDTAKALRLAVKDGDGVAIDITAGRVRLFATGAFNGDKPRTDAGEPWTGIHCTVTDGPAGLAEVVGIGGMCDISSPGVDRISQIYDYEATYVDEDEKVAWSKRGFFRIVKPPDGATP